MEVIVLNNLPIPIADILNRTVHLPVGEHESSANYLCSTLLSLACSRDLVRIFPRRPILLKWEAENVYELGMIDCLDAVDESGQRGVALFRLTRSNYMAGIMIVFPLERYWVPFARVPHVPPEHLSCA